MVLSEQKLAEHREKQLVAPAVPALTGEEPWTYEALEQRFASRATPGGLSPAGGGDFGGGVASLGHELLDIAEGGRDAKAERGQLRVRVRVTVRG